MTERLFCPKCGSPDARCHRNPHAHGCLVCGHVDQYERGDLPEGWPFTEEDRDGV